MNNAEKMKMAKAFYVDLKAKHKNDGQWIPSIQQLFEKHEYDKILAEDEARRNKPNKSNKNDPNVMIENLRARNETKGKGKSENDEE